MRIAPFFSINIYYNRCYTTLVSTHCPLQGHILKDNRNHKNRRTNDIKVKIFNTQLDVV